VVLDDVPRSAGATLVRRTAQQRIAGRWDRPLTTVVAGAGFGKTTLLGQAFETDRSLGEQRFFSVSASTAGAAAFAQLLADGWQVGPLATDDPAEMAAVLADHWWGLAPTRIGVIVDDHHLLREDGRAFVEALLDVLPTNAHLLTAGRDHLGVAARLIAAGRVVVIDESELVFNRRELEQFAELRGVPIGRIEGCEGWPVLAELCAVAPANTASEYLWQEILETIPERRRRDLAVASLAGWMDPRTCATLVEDRWTITELVAGLPMVLREGELIKLHDLWREPLAAMLSPAERDDASRLVAGALVPQGRAGEAFALLAERGLWDDALAMARLAVIDEHLMPSPSTARAWLSSVPATMLRHPIALLLDAVARRGAGPHDAIGALQTAFAANLDADDRDAAVCALVLLGTVSFGIQDRDLGIWVVQRAGALAEAGHEGARRLVLLAEVILHLTVGDTEAALSLVTADETGAGPLAGLSRFLHARCLCESGRLESCHTLLVTHRATMTPYRLGVAVLEARVRWMRGDLDGARRELGYEIEAARAGGRTFDATMFATLDRLLATVAGLGFDASVPLGLDDELPTLATAFHLLTVAVRHQRTEPDVAVTAISALLRRGGIGAVIPELRTLLPVLGVDVPVPSLQGVLGASTRVSTAVAQRRLDPTHPFPFDDVGGCLHLLPPVVLAEVAANWGIDHDHPPHWLDRLGRAAREEVRVLAGADGPLAAGAIVVVEQLGPEPPHALQIGVLGDVEVHIDGRRVDGETRRERVRALLILLVVHDTITRTRAAELLWPDLGARAAANNLRTTLSYLIRTLEPSKAPGEVSFFVRQHGVSLELRKDPSLAVDSRAFLEELDRARDARREGRTSDELAALLRGIGWWRDQPGHDIAGASWAEVELDHWVSRFAGAAIRAADLLVDRDPQRASELARRTIAIDRWSLAGHAVLVRAALALDGPTEAQVALDRYARVAAELGLGEGSSEHRQLRATVATAASPR